MGRTFWVAMNAQCRCLSAILFVDHRCANKESKSRVKNHSPGYMEQAPSRGHEASPQSELGVRYKRCSSSKELRGLSVRAQARRINTSPSFSVAFFFFSPRSCLPRAARRGAARGSAMQGLGKGGALSLVLIVQATAEEVNRVIANRDLNPGYVGAMH